MPGGNFPEKLNEYLSVPMGMFSFKILLPLKSKKLIFDGAFVFSKVSSKDPLLGFGATKKAGSSILKVSMVSINVLS